MTEPCQPRALVTGAAGFIGRALCQQLLKQGWQVVALDALLSPSAHEGVWALQDLAAQSALQFKQVSLLEPDVLSHCGPVDCIFHLAGLPGVRPSWEQAADYWRHNLTATQRLLEWALQTGAPPLIFTSSSSVYGSQAGPTPETAPLNPGSWYAESKVAAEQLLATATQQTPLKVVILRLFSVYGPGQRPDMALRRFVTAIAEKQPLVVHSPQLMHRDFTHLRDILQGILQSQHWLMDQPCSTLGCFNLGAGQSQPLSQLLHYLESYYQQTLDCVIKPPAQGEALSTWADISRACQVLGYQPCVKLKQGIFEYCQWFEQLDREGKSGHGLCLQP